MSDIFERQVEVATNSVLMNVGIRSRDPALRVMALDHATKVDERRGGSHQFGTLAIVKLMGMAEQDRGGEKTKVGIFSAYPDRATETAVVDERYLKMLDSVMEAFGMEEGEGVSVSKNWSQGHTTVDFDYSVPGVAFVETATDVIACPPTTLHI